MKAALEFYQSQSLVRVVLTGDILDRNIIDDSFWLYMLKLRSAEIRNRVII